MENKEDINLDDELRRSIAIYRTMKSVDKVSGLNSVLRKIRIGNARYRRLRLLRNCAAVILPLMLAGGVWIFSRQAPVQEPIPRISQNVVLLLPDGSEIILDDSTSDADISSRQEVAINSVASDCRPDPHKTAESAEAAEPAINTLFIPKGRQYEITLEDGTTVWLNAESRLHFPASFAKDQRRVTLEGEAYFKVAADPARPFIVQSRGQSVEVLGTEFNITAYPDEGVTLTTLINGSIMLQQDGSDSKTVMEPNKQAVLIDGREGFVVSAVNVGPIVAWRHGVLEFDGMPLRHIMKMLARWYDFEYEFEDEGTESMMLVGRIPYQEDIESVIRIIESTGIIRIEVSGQKIVIRKEE